jgi:hypothetical protein
MFQKEKCEKSSAKFVESLRLVGCRQIIYNKNILEFSGKYLPKFPVLVLKKGKINV